MGYTGAFKDNGDALPINLGVGNMMLTALVLFPPSTEL